MLCRIAINKIKSKECKENSLFTITKKICYILKEKKARNSIFLFESFKLVLWWNIFDSKTINIISKILEDVGTGNIIIKAIKYLKSFIYLLE